MFWFKACPRCRGDLFLDPDTGSRDVVCLQCGYRKDYRRQEAGEALTTRPDPETVDERLVGSGSAGV